MAYVTALRHLGSALDDNPLAPMLAPIRDLVRRVTLRVQALAPPAAAAFEDAIADLAPTLELLPTAARAPAALDARRLRDVTTVCRRLHVTLDHVQAPPGVHRLPPAALPARYTRVGLDRLLGRTCDAFTRLASERELTYEVSVADAPVAEVDADKLEQAVGTMLFNALKYTPRGGFVRCTAHGDERADEVVIRVEDSGPPIPADRIDTIFDRTREADRSVAIVVDDLRLSLGLVRDGVAILGGTLEALPQRSGEAVFELRVPRTAPTGATVSSREAAPAPWLVTVAERAAAELRIESELDQRPVAVDGRAVVLVIEAARSLNRTIVDDLEPDHATASAFDGEAGLETALSLRPDVVVVGLGLPGIDGEAVVQALRAQPDLPCAILAVAERPDETQILRLLDAGAHDILTKPFLLTELRARVARLVASKRTQDVLSETIGQRDTDLIALASEVADAHHNLELAYQDLQAARERAERLSAAKSNFLRIMSHELKTPVTAMKLQLSVLDSDPRVAHTPVLDRGLERLARSTTRLLQLVDTVLEWSRVADGRYRPDVAGFDLLDLVEEVTAELEGPARLRDLEVRIVSPVHHHRIESDRRLLRLIVINLLERAISVSGDGHITIEIRRTERGSRIRVHDLGPALSPRQRREAFDPLEQAQDFHRRSGAGSGLGVHAIRDIARAVGGELRHVPCGEVGNVFALDLPPRYPDTIPVATAPAPPPAPTSR